MDANYYTFYRSATSLEDYAKAEKETVETDLTLAVARQACYEFNSTRCDCAKASGLKMEFEEM